MARQWDKMEGQPTKPVARSKVARSRGQRPITVIVNIRPGPVSERQKRLWRAWWMRLIAECKREPKSEAQK